MRAILIIFFLFPAFGSTYDCPRLFVELVDGIEYYDGFYVTHFTIKKNQFLSELSRGSSLSDYNPGSPEELLALSDAYFDLMDVRGISFENLFRNGLNRRQRRAFNSVTSAFKSPKGPFVSGRTRAQKMLDLVGQVYLMRVLGDEPFFTRQLLKFKTNFIRDDFISSRVAIGIMKQGMEGAMVEMGLIKSPWMRNEFIKWKELQDPRVQQITRDVANFISVAFGKKKSTHMIENADYSAELYAKMMNGIDGAKPMLKAEFGHLASFQLIWKRARRMYVYGMVSVAGWFVVKKSNIKEVVGDFLQLQMDEYFDRNGLENEYEKLWVQQFLRDHGRAPTDAEFASFSAQLEAMGDRELERKLEEIQGRSPASSRPSHPLHHLLR